MKARRKGTNDEWQDIHSVALANSEWNLIKAEAIEFEHDTLSTELKTYDQMGLESSMQNHWQDVRERAAVAVMQSFLASDAFRNAKIDAATNIGELPEKEIAATSIRLADALVKQLKGE